MITGEDTGLMASGTQNASAPPTTIPAPAAFDSSVTLPEQPVISFRPSTSSWVAIDVGKLWEHRELFYLLVWRDLKVRYRQTILGAAWVVLQPVLITIIFTVFLGSVVRVPSDNLPYPLFAYAGLLLWTFFSNAVLSSSYSLVANAHTITKVYFARLIIPASAVGVRLVDLIIASTILFALMAYYGLMVGWSVLLLPVFILEITLLSLSIGIWTSALNVRYRDVNTLLPVLLQLWMFASPIIYPSSLVPQRWRWLYELNPLTGIIEGFRAALFNQRFEWRALFLSAVITLALLICSLYAFRRMEASFADTV